MDPGPGLDVVVKKSGKRRELIAVGFAIKRRVGWLIGVCAVVVAVAEFLIAFKGCFFCFYPILLFSSDGVHGWYLW